MNDRLRIATAAMQGILASETIGFCHSNLSIAIRAFLIADRMLAHHAATEGRSPMQEERERENNAHAPTAED